MIDFLDKFALSKDDFNLEQEFLIDEFLPKKLITMLYAEGGIGKSYLALSIAKHLLDNNKDEHIYYLDFDNPMTVLKNRGVDTLIANYPNLTYIQRSCLDIEPQELIKNIESKAVGKRYENALFIIDSIRDIVDIRNDRAVMGVLNSLKNIREAGASLLLLSHSNKDGKNYEGSVNIRNSIDCMYQVKKRPSSNNTISFVCDVEKERAGITSNAFSVRLDDLELSPLDVEIASMNEYELEFVNSTKRALANTKLNKTQLLNAIGKDKKDKTASKTLDKFSNKFYYCKKVSNQYTYSLCAFEGTNATTSSTSPKIGALV